jgi:DUF4097 and DUF4098 domain-containing protein YvlB
MNKQRIFSLHISISIPARLSFLAIGLALLLAPTSAAASTPQGHFEKTLQVTGPVNLEVETRSGDITVRSGGSGSVTIQAKIYVGDHWLFGNRHTDVSDIEQHPPVRQDGNSIHIDNVSTRDISIDYEIIVPVDTTIRSHSGSGNETIEGTRGNVDVTTGSGDMKLSRLTGEIHLQTGSGNVRAREIAGPVRGGAGSGDIEMQEIASGDIDLHTGSGNVSVRGIQGALRAEAGSGDITAEGTQAGAWEIRTGSGNVHVRLPANAAFDGDISTSSGTLDVNAPITTTVQGRVQETRKHIVGKAGGGGSLLSVKTGSGDIHIE